MRLISTVVLPLPAPARISSGPSVASTACRCMGFRAANSSATTALRASMYFLSKSVFMASNHNPFP